MLNARYESKPLKLAARVRTKADGREGYVTKIGFLRMRRAGADKIDVYFPERQARGYTFMTRRLFVAGFLELIERIEEQIPVGTA